MSRFNLICNGMMIFHEQGDHVQIVIPTIPSHVRKFCSAPKPARSNLVDLPVGQYRLSGLKANPAPLRKLFDPMGYVVLQQGPVSLSESKASRTCAVITVPKPTLVRFFRPGEPDDNSKFLGRCSKAIHAMPSVLHDIVVFSYTHLPAGLELSLGAGMKEPVAIKKIVETGAINWAVYSNEGLPLQTGSSHATALNDFLSLDGKKTNLVLSGIGPKDGVCDAIPIGLGRFHLALYHELPEKPKGDIKTKDSGEPICSGVCIAC